MAFVTLGTVAPGDVLRASSGTAAYNSIIGNLTELAPFFSGWTSWTPTLAQGATPNIAKTVTYAKYLTVGKLAIANCRLDVTGTGSAGAGFTISLPSAITAAATLLRVGSIHVFDASTSVRYAGVAEFTSTTTVSFVGDWSGNGAWGANPNLALGASDQLNFSIMYEIA